MARKKATSARSKPAKARPARGNDSAPPKVSKRIEREPAPPTRTSARIGASHLHAAKPGVVQTSRLLTTIPEIRNLIYEFTLCDGPILIKRQHFEVIRTFGPPVPAILRVCQQIRNEAMPMYYGLATFFARDIKMLRAWVRQIGPQKGRLLRRLQAMRYSREHRDFQMDFYGTVENLRAGPRYSSVLPAGRTMTERWSNLQ